MDGLAMMNGLDYVVIVVTVMGVLYGLSRGVLRIVTSALSLIGGLYFASTYYQRLADIAASEFGAGSSAARVIAYIAIFMAIFIAIEIAGTIVINLLHLVNMGWIDRLAGGVLGGALGAAMMGLVVMLLAMLLPANSSLLKHSTLAPDLLAYDETLIGYIPPEAKQTYESRRAELLAIWKRQALSRDSRQAQSTPSPAPR